jgi:hypothetical protein
VSAAKKRSHLKKKRARRRAARERQQQPAPLQPAAPLPAEPPNVVAAYSISGFCRAHDISVSMFHKLRTLDLAPEVMCVGARRLISVEAAARWRAEREREAAA